MQCGVDVGRLFREWRGTYEEPVALIGDQLAADDARLREAAVSVLEDLFELAAPAADRLAALVTADPECWVRRWEHGAPTLGGPLKALRTHRGSSRGPALARCSGRRPFRTTWGTWWHIWDPRPPDSPVPCAPV